MFGSFRQLACLSAVLLIQSTYSQEITATATHNGIISAQGGPAAATAPAQPVSYSILGGGVLAPSADATQSDGLPIVLTATPTSTHAATDDGLGSNNDLSSGEEQSLSPAAIAGITAGVVMSIVLIILVVMFSHRRRKATVARAKRKSIMDKEFAASKQRLQHYHSEMAISKQRLHHYHSEMATYSPPNSATGSNIGYFDIAKPLPAVIATEHPVSPTKSKDDDCLSRSSTIIADAAEIAQINRKASTHQARGKKSREAQRERNQALQILITSDDNKTTAWPHSPLASNPSTPVDAAEDPNGNCPDGNGDSFSKRPSRI